MGTLLGALVLWFGYDLVAFGWSELHGGTAGLKNLSFPGQWQGIGGSSSSGSSGSGQLLPPGASQPHGTPPKCPKGQTARWTVGIPNVTSPGHWECL